MHRRYLLLVILTVVFVLGAAGTAHAANPDLTVSDIVIVGGAKKARATPYGSASETRRTTESRALSKSNSRPA